MKFCLSNYYLWEWAKGALDPVIYCDKKLASFNRASEGMFWRDGICEICTKYGNINTVRNAFFSNCGVVCGILSLSLLLLLTSCITFASVIGSGIK